MIAVAIPMKISVDNNEVAKLKNGESKEVEVTVGEHEIIVDTIGEVLKETIECTSEYRKIYVKLGMKLGLLTGKAKIESIEKEK